MSTKILLMCAGENKRWNETRNDLIAPSSFPKQLAVIGGKPNIVRTIDLLIQQNIKEENIFVIVNKHNISKFPKNLNLHLGDSNREIDRFRNGFNYMDNCDKIIFLYGDVVYHIDDLMLILNESDDAFVGRSSSNNKTTKLSGEIVGVTVKDFDNFKKNVNEVANKFEKKLIKREIGWDVYYNQKDFYKFIEVSEYTDDFDTIHEYVNVSKLYKEKGLV